MPRNECMPLRHQAVVIHDLRNKVRLILGKAHAYKLGEATSHVII